MNQLFKKGDRVVAIDNPAITGVIVRARRVKRLQNVDVLLDKGVPHYAAGLVLGSINGCWMYPWQEVGKPLDYRKEGY